MSLLTELHAEIEGCKNCELARHRTKVVPGEGPEDARLLFIGEAPGWNEDQTGRPFVGSAGQYLDQLIGMIGYKRHQVFIANVIKCRPPENRDPMPGEIMACGKWLERQLDLIKPRVIVTLGRFSMAKYFPSETHQQGAWPLQTHRQHHLFRHVPPGSRPAPGQPAQGDRG